MPDATYVENPAGIRQMLASPMMAKTMKHVGDLIRIRAEQIAPVRTGAYAFGLPGEPGVTGGGFKVTPILKDGSAAVRVSNDVRSAPSKNWPSGYAYGVGLEFGNSRITRQRPLGRALDAVAASRI